MKRPIIALLVCGQLTLLTSCAQSITGLGGTGNGAASGGLVAGVLGTNDLGLAMYQLYQSRISASGAAPAVVSAELAALAQQETAFVQAVNDIVNASSVGGGVQTAQSLFSLVDDGTIPDLANDMAQVLQLLQNDPAAEQAIVTLLTSLSSVLSAKGQQIPLDDLFALIGRIDNYPDVAQLWQATANIVQQNPQLVQQLLTFGSAQLEAAQVATVTTTTTTLLSGIASGLESSLLAPATLGSGQSFGSPEWVVKLDSRGLPTVATDPITGSLVAPFVAGSGGLAQTDGQGDFLDANGAIIPIVAYGTPGATGFDSQGRALTPSGQIAFVYFDAKTTTMGVELKLAGDLLRGGADVHGMAVLEAALGPPNPDLSYPDGPVPDLIYGGLELLTRPDAPLLLRALSSLLQSNPDQAEQLLVGLSQAVTAIQSAQTASAQAGGLGAATISSPQMVQLTDGLLPLLDDVFTAPSSGGSSTARVLFSTLDTLSTQAPDWPTQLAPLFVMHSLSPAVPVDFSQPPTYTGAGGATVDNRSVIQQLLDLLKDANGCSMPLTNETLAEFIMSSMASLSPSTVSTLSSLVTSVPGFVLNIACPGISTDIASLQDLAASGALDGLLPIAKAFDDQGQVPLLVQILVLADQSYTTTIRPVEPDVQKVFASGAVEQLCSLIGQSTQITDPTTGTTLADIIADSIADLVNQHSSSVVDRQGQPVPSLAYLLLDPLRAIDARLLAANAEDDLSALLDTFVQVVLAITPDPATGADELANGCILPFMTNALAVMANVVPADPAQRAALVAQAQTTLESAVLSQDMGMLVSVEQTILSSSSSAVIDAALVNLLTPNLTPSNDIFGSIMQLLAIELQSWIASPVTLSPANASAVVALENFAGQAIDPKQPFVQDVIVDVTKILLADQGNTILGVQRAAFNPAADSGQPPAAVLIGIFEAVSQAGAQASGSTGAAPPISLTDLQGYVQDAIAAITDPNGAVAQLFQIILNRNK